MLEGLSGATVVVGGVVVNVGTTEEGIVLGTALANGFGLSNTGGVETTCPTEGPSEVNVHVGPSDSSTAVMDGTDVKEVDGNPMGRCVGQSICGSDG